MTERDILIEAKRLLATVPEIVWEYAEDGECEHEDGCVCWEPEEVCACECRWCRTVNLVNEVGTFNVMYGSCTCEVEP